MVVEAGRTEVGWNDGISWVWPIMKKKEDNTVLANEIYYS